MIRHLHELSPALVAFGALALFPAAIHATGFAVTNLVTDDQGANAAQQTDADLVNAWGVSYAPTGPFWVSDNGTGLSTLYSVDPATNATSKLGLVVSIPGDGSVTGQAFNGTSDFNGDAFLFANEDGTISGWRGALGTNAEVLQLSDPGNSYKGTAIGKIGSNSYLYSANFATSAIDVLKGDAGAPDLAAHFVDPILPAGLAPFNVQNLGGTLYVTYAVVGPNGDDVAGAGNGIVDAFDLQGNFLARVATGGALDSPWGLAIAPASFGEFAGDLLVGNFGDGKINAYDLATKTLGGHAGRRRRHADRDRRPLGPDPRQRCSGGRRRLALLHGRPERGVARALRGDLRGAGAEHDGVARERPDVAGSRAVAPDTLGGSGSDAREPLEAPDRPVPDLLGAVHEIRLGSREVAERRHDVLPDGLPARVDLDEAARLTFVEEGVPVREPLHRADERAVERVVGQARLGGVPRLHDRLVQDVDLERSRVVPREHRARGRCSDR